MLTLQSPSSDLDRTDTPPSLVFDRRIGARYPAAGALLGAVTAEDGVRLIPLQLVDAGAAGAGAISPTRLRPGARISLHPIDTSLARDCGIVARCDEHPDGGYLVGIAFDTRMAA